MNRKVRQMSLRKNVFVFIGGILLFLLLTPVQASCTATGTGIATQGNNIWARLNIQQIFPGTGQSSGIDNVVVVRCDGGSSTLTMYSAMNAATWRHYYNAAELSTARGIVDVTVRAPGSQLTKRYDLIRGSAGGNDSSMIRSSGPSIDYTFTFTMAPGQAQIISETRHLTSPPAENNTIATISGGGGGATIMISSGLTPVLDYCAARYFIHSGPGTVDFGAFNEGMESSAYNRIKQFDIRVRSDSRCHKTITPIVSFSHISGGVVSASNNMIKLENGLQIQLRQSNLTGRVVLFDRRTKHTFPSTTPGPPSVSLPFEAVLSKQPGATVTSGKFSTHVRYHLEYR